MSTKTINLIGFVSNAEIAGAFKTCNEIFANGFHILATGTEKGTDQSRRTFERAIPSEKISTFHDVIWTVFEQYGNKIAGKEFIAVLDFPSTWRCRQFIVKVLQSHNWDGRKYPNLSSVYFHHRNGFYIADYGTDFQLDKSGELMKAMLFDALPMSDIYCSSHLFQNYLNDLMVMSIDCDEWKMIGYNLMENCLSSHDLTIDGQPASAIQAVMNGVWIDYWRVKYYN